MFNYRKVIAHISLALFILTSVFILALSLQPGADSGSLSGGIYTSLLEIFFGEEKREEEVETVALTSIEISTLKDSYLVGNMIDIIITADPVNHTNVLTYYSSNKSIAYFNSTNRLVFKTEGQVTVWVESDNGIVSNQLTLTCEEPKSSLEGLDLTLFSIICPDVLYISQDPDNMGSFIEKRYSLDYRYNEQKIDISCSMQLTNSAVAEISGKSLIAKDVGTTTIELYCENTLLATKEVEIKEGAFNSPSLVSILIGNNVVENGNVQLIYGESYKVTVNFEDGIERKLRVLAQASQNPAVSATLGDDNSSIYFSAIACNQSLVRILLEDNPVIDEYVAEFTITVVPPRAIVTGIEISDEVVINTKYKPKLVTTNKYAKQGYTYTITDKENAYIDTNGNITFYKSGTYEIVFTSTFYPEDVYKFSIVVVDPKEELSLRKHVGHFGIFLILGIFGLLAFGRYPKRNGYKCAFVLGSGAFVATLSEILQTGLFTQGREARFIDVLIDLGGYLVGVIIVFAILFLIFNYRKRRFDSAEIDDE